jgi:hypothetical protein
MVRMERLELSRLAALEPKSSVYTNFTTSASNLCLKYVIYLQLLEAKIMGWLKGIEPSTTGITILRSTN